MNQVEKSIKEEIILATISCIEKEGIHSITTRSIAKEAKVNTAAINYYFGTKKNLLDEVFKYTLNQVFADSEAKETLKMKSENHRSTLETYLARILEGMLSYPNITKAHFYNPLLHNDYQGISAKYFSNYLSQLLKRIAQLEPKVNKKEVQFSVVQIISATMFPGLLPDIFQKAVGVNFKHQSIQREYVNHLVRQLLKH